MSTVAKYRRIKGACLRDKHRETVNIQGALTAAARNIECCAALVETGESRTPRPESFTGRHLRA